MFLERSSRSFCAAAFNGVQCRNESVERQCVNSDDVSAFKGQTKVNTNVCPLHSHAGRERTPLLPDWQRESVPPLYFLLPLFLSAAASCHAPRRCQGRGVGSQSRRLNRRKRARGRASVCLPTGLGQGGLRVWKTARQERGVKPLGVQPHTSLIAIC